MGRWVVLVVGLLAATLLGLWPVNLSILGTRASCGPAAFALFRPVDQTADNLELERAGIEQCHAQALPLAAGAFVATAGTALLVLLWPRRRPHLPVNGPNGPACVTCGSGWPCRSAWEAGGPIHVSSR